MRFKSKNKANLCQIRNFTLFKKTVFSYQNPLKKLQATGPQRVPPCRFLHVQLKIGISTCNKKTTFLALAVFLFPSSLVFLIVVERFLIVIALDLSKPYRSLGEELGFSIYYCKADPP